MDKSIIEELYPETMFQEDSNPNTYYFDSNVFNGPINLEEINIIEQKLRTYTSYYARCKQDGTEPDRSYGLSLEEVSKYLDWVVYRSRSSFTENSSVNAKTYDFTGCCNPSQQEITKILDSVIGKDNVHPFNTASIISHPDSEVDKRQFSTASRHCATIATFPILDENGIAQDTDMLVDATFRQFCMAKDCTLEKYDTSSNPYTNKPAPLPGFFLMESYEGGQLATALVERGYVPFDGTNAKLYGDAFSKSSISACSLSFLEGGYYRPFNLEEITQYKQEKLVGNHYEFEVLPTDSSFVKSPEEYIQNAKTKEMERYLSPERQTYAMSLQEIEDIENNKFSNKVKSFFNKVFGKKQEALPAFTPPLTSTTKTQPTSNPWDLDQYPESEQTTRETSIPCSTQQIDRNNTRDDR